MKLVGRPEKNEKKVNGIEHISGIYLNFKQIKQQIEGFSLVTLVHFFFSLCNSFGESNKKRKFSQRIGEKIKQNPKLNAYQMPTSTILTVHYSSEPT